MSEIRKEQEREELHRAIWAIADDLRGAVDGWDFKIYVLTMMFYRYLSENLTEYINKDERAAGDPDFDYAKITDEEAEDFREDMLDVKGFFIPPSELFCNMAEKSADDPNDQNLNVRLEQVFSKIEASAIRTKAESNFKGLFEEFDVGSAKLGQALSIKNKKLRSLLNGVAAMNLSQHVKDRENDTFGDAYEYLMGMYASSAGKSGGEFFTPSDVSTLLARLGTFGKTKIDRAYDPAVGSGSLLLKVEQILGKGTVLDGYYGQEINLTTYNLCRINMFLHDIEYDKFNIACGDTLIAPHIWETNGKEVNYDPSATIKNPFDLIVSNPPYSIHWVGSDNPTLAHDARFNDAGVLAPKSAADMAFIMHCYSWLAESGTAAIVCFPGVMYRGAAEGKIRKFLVEDRNGIDCIIQLPSNLFYGTSIATCIMVLKKNKKDRGVLFIDASREFVKVTKNNRLTPENIEKIVAAYANRQNVKGFSYLASPEEIAKNDYNLSVSTYVESIEEREQIDIAKHNAEIKEIVAREQKLRDEIDAIIEEIENAG